MFPAPEPSAAAAAAEETLGMMSGSKNEQRTRQNVR